MNLVSLGGVCLRYGANTVLDGVDLNVMRGESVALIGRNGCGKTSLLGVIAGTVVPDGGRVERMRGLRAAYLPQEVPGNLCGTAYSVVAGGLGETGSMMARYAELSSVRAKGESNAEEMASLSARISEGGLWDADSKIRAVLEILEMPPDLEMSDASAGIRRRALLGRGIVSRPDILLLDEPTNHLDIDSVLWLEKFLKTQVETLVFVSHDRTFLGRVTDRVVEIDRGKLVAFDCGFDEFMRRRDAVCRARERSEAVFDKKLAREEEWLRRGVKARRTRNEGRVRELERLREIRRGRREKPGVVNFCAQDSLSGGQKVLDVKGVSLSFGGVPIVKDFSTTIFRGDKIGIIRRNGVGKTSLLNVLLGNIKPDCGSVVRGTSFRVAYFDQLRSELDDNAKVFDFVGGGSDFVEVNGQKQSVMGYLQNFLFEPRRALCDIGTLSGGEKSRLMLAKMFASPANLLVLDEPTNDLDLQTIDVLEKSLADFKGTVLLVSHDRAFLNNVVNGVFCLDGNGKIVELAGGYDEWENFRPRFSSCAPQVADLRPAKPAPNTGAPRKFTNREREELKSLPSRIEAVEAERGKLSAKLQDQKFVMENFDKLEGINARLRELAAEDDALMERWAELEERRMLIENLKRK